MNNLDFDLPSHVHIKVFDHAEQASDALSNELNTIIQNAVKIQGKATIALSGGSTPVPMFKALNQMPLPWNKMVIALVDDRWLPPTHPDSNEALVTQHLLGYHLENTNFIGFWEPDGDIQSAESKCNTSLASKLPDLLDAVVLGMGNDGHTASLFPQAPQLEYALNTASACCAISPITAPHERMTMSANRLLASSNRFLHLKGKDKLETLKNAVLGNDVKVMPIRLFLKHPLTIYWSP
ncbi:6-phosphogluconolactonase [Neptuniibacter sp.]|uniref:6-phosphogluconolactonase n=1 Tax=Neptuniibacter sp. TaxID=1962643 RepID=UPI003B5A694B